MRRLTFGFLTFGQMFMLGLSVIGAAHFFGEQNKMIWMFLVACICSFVQSVCTITILAEWAVNEHWRWRQGGEQKMKFKKFASANSDLAKQYNTFAKEFSAIHDVGENSNRYNREVFYGYIDFISPGTKVLDLGCGDGFDLLHYQELGATVSGLDASEEMLAIARFRLPNADIRCGLFSATGFDDAMFDAVLSKYSVQTTNDIEPVYREVRRVLKPGGTLLLLVTHPFGQFFERRGVGADYFSQTVVISNILGGAIQVAEPTHMLSEYLSPFFLQHFDLVAYDECWDRSAEQIDGQKYPGFLLIKANKR